MTNGGNNGGSKRRRRKRPLKKREKKFVEGVARGKSDRQAALEAGFSLSTAEDTKDKLWSRPQVQEYFERIVRETVPPRKVVEKLSEHIEGKSVTTKTTKRTEPGPNGTVLETTIVERTETVDGGLSLRALERAVEWGRMVPPKQPGGQSVQLASSGPIAIKVTYEDD